MNKTIICLFLLVLIIPSTLAIDLDIQKQSSDEIYIPDIGRPIKFDLKITNNGETDNFNFHNLVGFTIIPSNSIRIESGETKDIELLVYPRDDLTYKGSYTFPYFIRDSKGNEQQEKLTMNVVKFDDAIELTSSDLYPDSNSIIVYLRNRKNFDFQTMNIKLSSQFFEEEKRITLGPNEKKNITIDLNKDNFGQLTAGFYTLNTEIRLNNKVKELEGTIKFAEKNLITDDKKDYGFFINTQTITKENKGNVIVDSSTIIKKNIFSRLFTSFNEQPDIVDREGFNIYYTWERKIKPSEKLEIQVKTNWFFPFIIILLIVGIVAMAKKYSTSTLGLKKKVSFVKAKGGEFALKVSVVVSARDYIERIRIIDRLPPLVKIHERFGGEHPTRVNEKAKTIEWDFEKLEKGESRVLSYIIYSKIGVLGKFALPCATAIFEKEGQIKESRSNRAFFVAEPRGKDIDFE